ncbi:hypothetical protein SynPROS91_02365 [Synechococcus sp. PROS-9-1]|nr:hypothetical protein SynPROS91_02365 [Synechococcus sp. PROS-9-1]
MLRAPLYFAFDLYTQFVKGVFLLATGLEQSIGNRSLV